MNGTYILKSGTDFRQFSTITVDFSQENLQVDIESVDVTAEYEPDNELSTLLEKYTGMYPHFLLLSFILPLNIMKYINDIDIK